MNAVYNLRKRPTTPAAKFQPAFKKSRGLSKNTNVKKVGGIQSMPVEIMTYIFELLDLETRISVEKVCRRWRNIARAHSWRKITSLDVTHFAPSIRITGVSKVERWKKKLAALAERCAAYVNAVNLDGVHRSFTFNYCWRVILSMIPANKLQHLRTSYKRIRNAQLKRLAQRFSSLMSIDIYGYTADATSLNVFFKTCTALEQVRFSGCNLDKASFEHLPSSLKSIMMFSCTGIDKAKIVQIGYRCPQLESLELEFVRHSWKWTSILSKHIQLRRLVIKDCFTVQPLSLERMEGLTHLDLSFNELLTDPLLESIGQLSQLNSLSLVEFEGDRGNYNEKGLLHLANLQQLEHLSFNACKYMTDFVLKAIAQNNLRLKKVAIPDCTLVTDDSILFLLDTCKQLNQLEVSDCNYVTEKTLEAIVQRLIGKHGGNIPRHNEPQENFFVFEHYGSKIGKKTYRNLKNPWLNVFS